MQDIVPTNGMTITEDCRLVPGVYHLPDGLCIGASNITIEGSGVKLISGERSGSGLLSCGYSGITIRNLSFSGYYHGLRIEDGEEITLEGITVRDTAEIDDVTTFLHLWKPVHEAYGGGIFLHGVRDSYITTCDVQHQMNGLLLYYCHNLVVEQNNASFNSGWGLYLSQTYGCTIQDNRMDFCNRVYRHTDGVARVEADAAGIVLVNGSSYNRILRNSCVCGGDGIFLCGYEHPGHLLPCNDNLFESNDCRLSPNNAIEATFSEGNIFRRNDCSRSNYGFWMGYSRNNVLEENHVEFNRWVGIAIEHGYGFDIHSNTISRNGEGIRLWTRGGGGPVVAYYPDQRVSYQFSIENNRIDANTIGFYGYTGDDTPMLECHDFHLRHNTFSQNIIGVQLGRVRASSIIDNTFSGDAEESIRVLGVLDVMIEGNHFGRKSGNSAAINKP